MFYQVIILLYSIKIIFFNNIHGLGIRHLKKEWFYLKQTTSLTKLNFNFLPFKLLLHCTINDFSSFSNLKLVLLGAHIFLNNKNECSHLPELLGRTWNTSCRYWWNLVVRPNRLRSPLRQLIFWKFYKQLWNPSF